MTHRPMRRWGAALAAILLVAACGGDDDDAGANDDASVETSDAEGTVEPTEPSGEPAPDDGAGDDGDVTPPPDEEEVDDGGNDDGGNDDGGNDDAIVIDDFDDIPDECVELMGEFLVSIEDSVSDIDWDTATLDDIESMGDLLDVPTEDFDARMAETGCDRYDIGVDDEQGLEFAIRIAEREAPGTVGWLEFIASFATLGDSTAGGSDGGSTGPGGDLPTDCEGTKAYLRDKAEEYGSIEAVPVNEFVNLSTAITNLTSQCTLEDVGAFYDDPTITDFLGG